MRGLPQQTSVAMSCPRLEAISGQRELDVSKVLQLQLSDM